MYSLLKYLEVERYNLSAWCPICLTDEYGNIFVIPETFHNAPSKLVENYHKNSVSKSSCEPEEKVY